MMLVAGALLKERPVRRSSEELLDDFHDWLSRYLLTRTDGKWLADCRDPCFVVAPPRGGYHDEHWRWSVTADYLDQKLVTDDDMTVLWGHWSIDDGDHDETIFVRSALASRSGAESLVTFLQTAPELGRFALPCAAADYDLEAGPLRLRGWVADEDVPARLDDGDPWSNGLRFPSPAPSEECIANLGLTHLPDSRKWTNDPDGVIRSESWTQLRGYGREEEPVSGQRLSANRSFLSHLLNGYPEDSLVLSVEVRRRPSRYAEVHKFETYTQPYVRYYIMGADGVAHALEICH
jgi:hypothetical protein